MMRRLGEFFAWMAGRGSTTTEVCLKVPADDLFDTMIVAPHTEINGRIYTAIENITQHEIHAGNLKVAVYTDSRSTLIQEKFRELYRDHYHDVLKEARHVVRLRFGLLFLFLLISVINIVLWDRLTNDLLVAVGQNIWAFTLWKIGDTFIQAVTEWRNLTRFRMIRNAEIRFYATLKPRKKTS